MHSAGCAAGTLVGLGGAYFATRLVQSWLLGIGRTDAPTIAGMAGVLVAMALMARYTPIRRLLQVGRLLVSAGTRYFGVPGK